MTSYTKMTPRGAVQRGHPGHLRGPFGPRLRAGPAEHPPLRSAIKSTIWAVIAFVPSLRIAASRPSYRYSGAFGSSAGSGSGSDHTQESRQRVEGPEGQRGNQREGGRWFQRGSDERVSEVNQRGNRSVNRRGEGPEGQRGNQREGGRWFQRGSDERVSEVNRRGNQRADPRGNPSKRPMNRQSGGRPCRGRRAEPSG